MAKQVEENALPGKKNGISCYVLKNSELLNALYNSTVGGLQGENRFKTELLAETGGYSTFAGL